MKWFVLAIGLLLSSMAQAQRPNFIFIITDDISPDDLGPYGNTIVPTPNLDRIATAGLVFDNAYNVISSCSPSRCAIITGRYPHNTGAPELHTQLPPGQRTFVQELKDAGYHTILSGKNHMRSKAAPLGFDVSSDSHPAGAENWVRHLRERPKDKPFFCWFASHDAHRGWQLNDKAPHYDPNEAPVPPMMYDGPLTRDDLAQYYHEVSRTDYYVGEVMKELQAQGATENTYLIYCSDNGRPFPRCKTYLYDSGTRTPLIVTGPGISQGRTVSLTSSIDYAPTILELAGLAKPETIQGVSFAPVLRRPQTEVRRVAFAERNWHVYPLHERMVRQGPWLYIWNAWPGQHNLCGESSWFEFPAAKELWAMAEAGKLTAPQKLLTLPQQPAEMLFNVKDDPYQLTNLAGHAEHAPAMNQMRELLDSWKQQTGDSVPKTPTVRDRDLHKSTKDKLIRGDLPGAEKNAGTINRPGPVSLEAPGR